MVEAAVAAVWMEKVEVLAVVASEVTTGEEEAECAADVELATTVDSVEAGAQLEGVAVTVTVAAGAAPAYEKENGGWP